jgi:nitric oxide synthase oxygenase domain/subunit
MTWSPVRYLPLTFLFLVLALATSGCASKEEIAMRRKYESRDERANREVFYDNWLIPSVSEEDKEFFYRSFWKKKKKPQLPPPEEPPQ